MGFRKLFASLGAGGASVDTVITEPNVVPGGIVQGEVRIQGGSVEQQIEGLSVGLQARVEVEGGDQEYKQDVVFTKQRLGGAFQVQPGALHVVPFGLEIPWETPITHFGGRHLNGMNIGVSTELEIARAVDAGDLDPIHVHPVPAQQAILDAFTQLGFSFRSADMERGHIRDAPDAALLPGDRVPAAVAVPGLNQVELTFVSDGREMDVVLEMDKKPGLFSEGSDTYRCFQVGLQSYQGTDWAAYLNQWIASVGSQRNWF